MLLCRGSNRHCCMAKKVPYVILAKGGVLLHGYRNRHCEEAQSADVAIKYKHIFILNKFSILIKSLITFEIAWIATSVLRTSSQ
ncbi:MULTISPECIES: hypothetical protein [unclassified Rickettsia]|uniref:hypothetical protein n=1 Tax=unclassified Rickettsia TaxID=114295 RepID=UPI003132F446